MKKRYLLLSIALLLVVGSLTFVDDLSSLSFPSSIPSPSSSSSFFGALPSLTSTSSLIPPSLSSTLVPSPSSSVSSLRRSPSPPRLQTLRFLHIPKTGTSFIIALRNYLPSCQIKDVSCFGALLSGGFPDKPLQFQQQVKGWSKQQLLAAETCNNTLFACQGTKFHEPWRKNETNVVLLLRHPIARLFSQWHWYARANRPSLTFEQRNNEFNRLVLYCLGEKAGSERPSKPPQFETVPPEVLCKRWASIHGYIAMAGAMLAGISPLDLARFEKNVTVQDYQLATRRLFSEVAFFGITEQWAETICTFHCELGGEPRASEYLNVRDNGSFDADSLPLHPLVRQHLVQLQLSRELTLYTKAKRVFEERAAACGCLNSSVVT